LGAHTTCWNEGNRDFDENKKEKEEKKRKPRPEKAGRGQGERNPPSNTVMVSSPGRDSDPWLAT
jgi:hypothetical protein